MIKKIYRFADINGGFLPFMSVINTDFHFARGTSDGVYFQEIDGEKTLLFSFRGVTATICRLSENADASELSSFLEILGIKNVLSDFFFEELCLEERAVLKATPEYKEIRDVMVVKPSSGSNDYKILFDLLSSKGSFETWYSLFSAKVNKESACGIYMLAEETPVSCAVAPFIFENTAVVAGVFTNKNHRNKGYATRCVKALLSELQKKNVENVYLWCEDKNISLYENTGFSVCGKIYIKKEE